MKPITKDFEKVLEAVEEGKPLKAISKSLNIPYNTVRMIRHKFFDVKYVRKEVVSPAQKSFFRLFKAARKAVQRTL